MKKLFTFVFCALCAVSVNATVVEIGTGGTTTTMSQMPIFVGDMAWNSMTQMIYLASEITPSGVTEGTITAISFYSTTYINTTRTLEVWLDNSSSVKNSSFYFLGNSSTKAAGTKVFSGNVTLPTAEGWYTITLDTPFAWDSSVKKNNLVVTINDITNTNASNSAKNHKSFTPSTTDKRGCFTKGGNGVTFDAGKAYDIQGTTTTTIPVIRITFEGGDDPEPEPTITVSGAELDFGSYYPAAETVSKTFKVTASDLTNDIALSTTATGVTINPTSIEQDNANLSGDGVEVTVTLGAEYTFTSGAKLSITSDGASAKEIALSATEVRDEDFCKPSGYTFFTYENATKSPYIGYVFYSEKLTISEVSNNQFKPYGSAAFMVDYSGIEKDCENSGKVANLRGKFVSEAVFKAFSFDYTAPEQTGIVIDENEDKSSSWPEDAGSGKSLIIKRTVVPNEWNSIILPTYLTSTEVESIFGSGTDLEEFTNAVVTSSNITLNFTKKTDGLEAGVPYLIKPTQAIANPLNLTNRNFKKTITPVEKNGIEFTGVLVPTTMDASGDDYIFVGANNTLFHPVGAGSLKGMRAYFHAIEPEAKAAIKKAPMISLGTSSTTAMTLVKPSAEKSYKAIENGRIVINVNGQKVNIFGQTVK